MASDKFTKYLTSSLIIAALLLPWFGTEYSYLALALIMCLGISRAQFRLPKTFGCRLLYFLPLTIFFSWVYGVVVALLLGVSVVHAFTNFVGLLFYLIFYALCSLQLDNKTIVRCIFVSALFVLLYDGYLLVESWVQGGVFLIIASSVSDYRVKYDPAVLYFSPFILTCLVLTFGSAKLIVFNKLFDKVMLARSLMMAFIFTFIFLTMSKGVIAVLSIFIIIASIYGFFNLFLNLKTNWRFLCFWVFCIFIIFTYFDAIQFIVDSFGNAEDSNSIRDSQFHYLMNEISFFGEGLGASLRSGYSRAEDAPYGFELTYINIIHKLGFASCFLFFAYIFVIFRSLKYLFTGKRMLSGLFLIGMMSYLLPGYGNPILISPNFVLIHVLCLIFLLNEDFDKKKKVD